MKKTPRIPAGRLVYKEAYLLNLSAAGSYGACPKKLLPADINLEHLQGE